MSYYYSPAYYPAQYYPVIYTTPFYAPYSPVQYATPLYAPCCGVGVAPVRRSIDLGDVYINYPTTRIYH